MFILKIFFLLIALYAFDLLAQTTKPAFKVVPLGVKGGLDESNLSAYLVAAEGTNNFICADAGTLKSGIDKAISNKVFKTNEATVLKNYIKGYLISHGHLDHIAGLIINSPDDTAKNIYCMPYVTEVLKTKYFTWESWANFANEGEKPMLGKYHYVNLEEGKETPLANTEMSVKAFSLSHSKPYQSTAFLLNNNGNYLLYLGDTGSDTLEHSDKLKTLWQVVAPLIKSHLLKAIFIEVSFPNSQPDKQLFGHLTPKLLMNEMTALSELTGKTALQAVSIVITHIKPSGTNEAQIKAQVKLENRLALKIIYPVQGSVMLF